MDVCPQKLARAHKVIAYKRFVGKANPAGFWALWVLCGSCRTKRGDDSRSKARRSTEPTCLRGRIFRVGGRAEPPHFLAVNSEHDELPKNEGERAPLEVSSSGARPLFCESAKKGRIGEEDVPASFGECASGMKSRSQFQARNLPSQVRRTRRPGRKGFSSRARSNACAFNTLESGNVP